MNRSSDRTIVPVGRWIPEEMEIAHSCAPKKSAKIEQRDADQTAQ